MPRYSLQDLTYYWVSFDGLEAEPALYENRGAGGHWWHLMGQAEPVRDEEGVRVIACVSQGKPLGIVHGHQSNYKLKSSTPLVKRKKAAQERVP